MNDKLNGADPYWQFDVRGNLWGKDKIEEAWAQTYGRKRGNENGEKEKWNEKNKQAVYGVDAVYDTAFRLCKRRGHRRTSCPHAQ